MSSSLIHCLYQFPTLPTPIKDDKDTMSHQRILDLIRVLGNLIQSNSNILSHILVKFSHSSLLGTDPDSLSCHDNKYHKTCPFVLFIQSYSPGHTGERDERRQDLFGQMMVSSEAVLSNNTLPPTPKHCPFL